MQESRKSIKEGNDWFCKANNQSLKVLKKSNLSSRIDAKMPLVPKPANGMHPCLINRQPGVICNQFDIEQKVITKRYFHECLLQSWYTLAYSKQLGLSFHNPSF